SRGISRGAGAITVGASGLAVRILSRATLTLIFGAGGTTAAFKVGEVRVVECETSGAGGMMRLVRPAVVGVADAFSSGEGGTALISGKVGAVKLECRPSAGSGPGFGLKASRFATAELDRGKFTLGASTTFSLGVSPRAT